MHMHMQRFPCIFLNLNHKLSNTTVRCEPSQYMHLFFNVYDQYACMISPYFKIKTSWTYHVTTTESPLHNCYCHPSMSMRRILVHCASCWHLWNIRVDVYHKQKRMHTTAFPCILDGTSVERMRVHPNLYFFLNTTLYSRTTQKNSPG